LAYKSISENSTLEPLDLTNCQDLKLIFKSDDKTIEFSQYFTGETAPKFGVCQFRIDESKFLDIKNLNKLGSNVFYITSTNQGFRNVLYSGLFTILDSAQSVSGTSIIGVLDNIGTNTDNITPSVSITLESPANIAIATRRINIESENANKKKFEKENTSRRRN
jgi:hypothetical protein